MPSGTGTGVVVGGGSCVGGLRGWTSVVLKEYKNLMDGSGADTSAIRRRLVVEWEFGVKGRKKGS